MRWLLTRGRVPFLLLLTLLTAWFALQASRVGVEQNNESLNADDPLQVAVYDRFRATFGSDEDLLLAVSSPRLLEADGLAALDALSRRIAALPGVRRVYSLTTVEELVAGDAGAEPVPLIAPPFDAPDVAARAGAALDRNPDLTGLLIGADRRTAGILIEIEERPGDTTFRATLIDALRALMAEPGQDVALHLSGIAVQKHDVSDFIQRDQRLLIPGAIAVLALALFAFFRTALGVVLPLGVTAVSVVVTLGTYHLVGLEVNAITALLPPILIVLSLAVCVHLMQGWLDADPTADPIDRILGVVRRLRFPIFFCALTTAFGFGSLITSDMPAVRQFGAFAALGVLVAFATGMTLVPIGLSVLPQPTAPLQSVQHRLLRRLLDWSAAVASAHPWRVLALLSAVTLLSLAGLPRIQNNTDLVRFLKPSAPLYQDTLFIDAHLAGTSMLEYVVRRADGAPLTARDDVRRLAAVETALRTPPEVTGVTSILTVLRQIQRAEHGGPLALPRSEDDTADAFDLLAAAPEHGLIRRTIAPDFTAARFNVRLHAVGTAVAAPLAAALREDGQRRLGDDYRIEATGAFYHVAEGSNRLVDSQVRSFAWALLLVFAAIGLLFRSVTLALLSVVPNLTPILWTGGLIGFAGIDLSTGTAMIASAVLGLIVDDTIHYLTQFYRLYRGDAAAAVRQTTAGIGAPLVMNNLILVLGFWVGCLGSFKPTIYFSLLSGVTMITGMLCDLLVTPACLMILHGRRRRRALTPLRAATEGGACADAQG